MKDVLEMRQLDLYGGKPENYLNDWVRRTDNLDNFGQYEVRVTQDPSTGVQWGGIVHKEDTADEQVTQEAAPQDAGEPAPSEPETNGRRKHRK